MASKYEYIFLKEFNELQPCYFGLPVTVYVKWRDGRETEHNFIAPAGRVKFSAKNLVQVEKVKIPKTAQLSQADEKACKEEFEEDFNDKAFSDADDWGMGNNKY